MARSCSLRFASVLVLALASATPGIAWAAGDTSTAEALFTEGVNALKRSDFKAACEAFAGSNDAEKSAGAMVNLGVCNEKQGKTATAWGWYRTGAGFADQNGNRERAELARKEAERLEPKLRKLVITVKAPAPGMTVLRDGVAVPAAGLGREVPVDPGGHVIEVSADGKKPYKTSVSVAAGPGVDRIEIPALEDAPVASPVAGSSAASGTSAAPVVAEEGGGQRTVGIVVGAAGAASLLAAGVFVAFTIKEDNDRQGYVDEVDKIDRLPAAQQIEQSGRRAQAVEFGQTNKNAAEDNRTVAIITGVGGVVLVGTGVVLYLTAGPKAEKKAALPPVMPWATKSGGGLGLSLTF